MSWRKTLKRMALLMAATGLVLGAWAFWLEPASLTVREQTLRLRGWQAPLSGLRVAVVTDLHTGSPFNGLDKLERIVDETNASRPDLILVPGDFVIQGILGGEYVPPEKIAAVLARLKAPLGVFACMGNHDWWLDSGRVAAALMKHGIAMLEDKAVRLSKGGVPFWLVGISDFTDGPHRAREAFAQVQDDAPVLAMTHNPDLFPTIVDERFSLLITGHTHGGQVRLPFLGRPVVPSRHGQRYAHGHVVEGGRHLFVSPGLGTSILPVRFRVPPEISLLTLQAAN
jgi:uncharacterized protein